MIQFFVLFCSTVFAACTEQCFDCDVENDCVGHEKCEWSTARSPACQPIDYTIPLIPINCTIPSDDYLPFSRDTDDEESSAAAEIGRSSLAVQANVFDTGVYLPGETSAIGGAVSWWGGVGGQVGEAKRWPLSSVTNTTGEFALGPDHFLGGGWTAYADIGSTVRTTVQLTPTFNVNLDEPWTELDTTVMHLVRRTQRACSRLTVAQAPPGYRIAPGSPLVDVPLIAVRDPAVESANVNASLLGQAQIELPGGRVVEWCAYQSTRPQKYADNSWEQSSELLLLQRSVLAQPDGTWDTASTDPSLVSYGGVSNIAAACLVPLYGDGSPQSWIREDASAVGARRALVLSFGGWDAVALQTVDTVQRIDGIAPDFVETTHRLSATNNSVWPTLSVARYGASCAANDRHIVVAGGALYNDDGNWVTSDAFDVYERVIGTDGATVGLTKVEDVPLLPFPAAGLSIVPSADGFFFLGGGQHITTRTQDAFGSGMSGEISTTCGRSMFFDTANRTFDLLLDPASQFSPVPQPWSDEPFAPIVVRLNERFFVSIVVHFPEESSAVTDVSADLFDMELMIATPLADIGDASVAAWIEDSRRMSRSGSTISVDQIGETAEVLDEAGQTVTVGTETYRLAILGGFGSNVSCCYRSQSGATLDLVVPMAREKREWLRASAAASAADDEYLSGPPPSPSPSSSSSAALSTTTDVYRGTTVPPSSTDGDGDGASARGAVPAPPSGDSSNTTIAVAALVVALSMVVVGCFLAIVWRREQARTAQLAKAGGGTMTALGGTASSTELGTMNTLTSNGSNSSTRTRGGMHTNDGSYETVSATIVGAGNSSAGRTTSGRRTDTGIDARFVIDADEMPLEGAKLLGKGAFGSVYAATWHHVRVAVKVLSVTADQSSSEAASFVAEARKMASMRPHANVVCLFGVVEEPYFAIVTEFLAGGSLDVALAKLRDDDAPQLEEAVLLRIARDVAAGIAHLHRESIVHRDMAARNVLLSDASLPRAVAKVADFGLARDLGVDRDGAQFHVTAQNFGPLKYMSPESLSKGITSPASDAYAYGCVLYELVTRHEPWVEETGASAVHRVLSGATLSLTKDAKDVPTLIADVAHRCFVSDPAKRPLMSAILEELDNAATVASPGDSAAAAATANEYHTPDSASTSAGFHATDGSTGSTFSDSSSTYTPGPVRGSRVQRRSQHLASPTKKEVRKSRRLSRKE